MGCLDFDFDELLEITINDTKFPILKSEGEIFMRACEDVEKMRKLQACGEIGALGKIHETAEAGVNFVLGDGAFEKIVMGKAISIPKAIEIYSSICETCFERYLSYVNKEYSVGINADA